MKYNLNTILAEALKEEGLQIVDKRGIKFENEAERNMLWEGRLLLSNFREDLSNYEYISDRDYRLAMQAFQEDFGLLTSKL